MRLLESKSVIALVSFRKPIGALRFAAGFFGFTLSLLSASSAVEAASEEEICRNSVQGRVAWHQNGDTSWGAANIAMLCQGTQNSAARISCFQTEIQTGVPWPNAIANCKAREQGPQANAPVQGQASLNAQQIGAVLYTPVTDPATKKLLAQVAPNEWRDVTNPGTSGQTIIRLEEVFRNDFEIRLVEPNCGMHVSIYTASAGSTNLTRAVTLARPNEEPARLGLVARYVRLSELPQSIPPGELRRMATAQSITDCSLITANLLEREQPTAKVFTQSEKACFDNIMSNGLRWDPNDPSKRQWREDHARMLCAGTKDFSLTINCFGVAVEDYGADLQSAIQYCQQTPTACFYKAYKQSNQSSGFLQLLEAVGYCHFPNQVAGKLNAAGGSQNTKPSSATAGGSRPTEDGACEEKVSKDGNHNPDNQSITAKLCKNTPDPLMPAECFNVALRGYNAEPDAAAEFCRFDPSGCVYQVFNQDHSADSRLKWLNAIGFCAFPDQREEKIALANWASATETEKACFDEVLNDRWPLDAINSNTWHSLERRWQFNKARRLCTRTEDARGPIDCFRKAVDLFGSDSASAIRLCASAKEESWPVECYNTATQAYGSDRNSAVTMCRYEPSSCVYRAFTQASQPSTEIKWIEAVGTCNFPDRVKTKVANAFHAWTAAHLGLEEKEWYEKKFPGDLRAKISEANRWSIRTNIEDTTLALENTDDACKQSLPTGDNCSYWLDERDCGTSCHIQGIALTQNGSIVINHSLDPVSSPHLQKCALISWSEPGQWDQKEGDNISWTTKCLFKNWHPSGMDATGDIVVTTDNWDNRDDDFDQHKGDGKIRFFDFSTGSPIELDKLEMGGANAVAISYRTTDQSTWLITAYPANDEYKDINVFRSNCYPLENEERCEFQFQQRLANVYVSSTGMSLMEDGDGSLVLMTMYSSDGLDKIRATEFIFDASGNIIRTEEDQQVDLGISQFQGIRLRPSCRFGCGLNVINGDLYFSIAGRDIGNIWSKKGQFEIGIYKVGD